MLLHGTNSSCSGCSRLVPIYAAAVATNAGIGISDGRWMVVYLSHCAAQLPSPPFTLLLFPPFSHLLHPFSFPLILPSLFFQTSRALPILSYTVGSCSIVFATPLPHHRSILLHSKHILGSKLSRSTSYNEIIKAAKYHHINSTQTYSCRENDVHKQLYPLLAALMSFSASIDQTENMDSGEIE